MRCIEEAVNSVGPVAYTVHGHDSSNGDDWKNRFSDQATSVVANPSACRINYRWRTTRDGQVLMDAGVGVLLRDVQRVDVLTRLRYFNEQNVAIGHPSWTAEVDPVVFVVRVQRPAHVENHFIFLNEETANKVAKALTQAVKLCSGQ
jgi:hypothetical protein